MLEVRKATEERKAQKGTRALQGRRESQAPALVSPLREKDRREKKVQRAVLALDILVIKESRGLRGLRGALVLLDLQLRWFDLGTALLCSRCLDPLDRRDHQGQQDPQDPRELMESLVTQERMGKLVPLGREVSQEIQELQVQRAKRVSVEKVSQDPEAHLVYQDLLDPALVTAQPLLIWRAQDSQTWTKSRVYVVFQAPQVHQALLALQGHPWHWDPTVQ